MPIREFFHLMQTVDDFDAVEERYNRLLSPRTFAPKHWSPLDKRWASLALVGREFVLELMQASTAPEDGGLPIPKFYKRFGQRLHSLSWYVDADDMPALFHGLRDVGVRVAAATGGIIPPGPVEEVPNYFFTFAKDTMGQLEFMAVGPEGHGTDPRFKPDLDTSFWVEEHPLHMEGLSHITVMTNDLDRARLVYGDVMGGKELAERRDAERHSVFLLVGYDTVVEFAKPLTDDSDLARDLATSAELPHAVTFKVRDLGDVERHLDTIGMAIAKRTADTITVDPAELGNAVVAFTTASIAR